MPLISAADFIERFDISDDIDGDKRITPHIGSASRRLRKWVGDTAYDDALLALPADADRKDALKNAEATLAFHYAVYGMNFPLSSKGIVATSMTSEGREMRKYLTPDETQKVASQMLELAREIAEPYMLSDGTPASSFEIIDSDDDTGEATTRMYGTDCC